MSQSLRKSGQFLSHTSEAQTSEAHTCRNPFVNQVSFFVSGINENGKPVFVAIPS